MRKDIFTRLIELLPNEDLGVMINQIQMELIRRNPPQGPAGAPGASYADLINRYGADGNNQLRQHIEGRIETIAPQEAPVDDCYLLADIPFQANYDTRTDKFVYTPTGRARRLLRKAYDIDCIDPKLRMAFLTEFEILINPKLIKHSSLAIHKLDTGEITELTLRLETLVKWHMEKFKTAPVEPIPYHPSFYEETADRYNVLEFNGQSLVSEIDWEDLVFKSAPFRTGVALNANAFSNLSQLIEVGEVPESAHLGKSPTVNSVFVRIGDSLIRVMTGNIPYSRFASSSQADHLEVLELRAAVNLTNGQLDCFGNVIPWAKILKEPGLDLEISLTGFFNADIGHLATKKGSAKFTAHDSTGEAVASILEKELEVVAFTLTGDIVEV